ncbi:glycoside hydrolase domain-containing protein [Lachnospira multipara]|uniref:glycoside hydrolase domain-containing protein n=1 Tax=Lachnospira multipara TaxID=28051 RepID=UPI000685E916|nr:glycoside hydrolase domain-containing protein [Lachnospira multipara]
MDEKVKEAQVWLNKTYGSREGFVKVEENGRTGNAVMNALVRALQIELHMSNITGYFGEETAKNYNSKAIKKGDRDSDNNFVRILQYGLFCKGYNPSAVTGFFGDGTMEAVTKVQLDAGFSEDYITERLSAKVFKEILCSDALVLVPGGDSKIRLIQQYLNRYYGGYFDIIPCDGKYNANTNKALIYAFQISAGMDAYTANGNFGPATQELAKQNTLTVGTGKGKLVKLAKFGLYINGVRKFKENSFDCSDGNNFTETFDERMENAVKEFQKFTGMLNIDGVVDIKVWMSLFVSTGYPKRDVLACDASTQITETKAKRIYANDFRIIGRYLTGCTANGPKNLTREELSILFNQGLSVFAIYQDEKEYYNCHPDEETTVHYYNYDQGYSDAKKAVEAAEDLGIPYGEPIFFAVDYDFNDDQTTDMIIPHFQGIAKYIRDNGHKYTIGCYGPRNICTRIGNYGYAKYSFVSDMSTGYSGNKGFILPDNWVFDQIREYTQGSADGAFALDCVATSGKYNGFNHIIDRPEQQIKPSSRDVANGFCVDTLKLLGIDVDIVKFNAETEVSLPGVTVKYKATQGESISIGDGFTRAKFDIVDGKIEDKAYITATKGFKNVSEDNSMMVDASGILDFQSKVQFMVNNGYIEMGVSLLDDGTFKWFILFHKNMSIEEGLEEYVELGLEFEFDDRLSEAEVQKYRKIEEIIATQEQTEETIKMFVASTVMCISNVFNTVEKAVNEAGKVVKKYHLANYLILLIVVLIIVFAGTPAVAALTALLIEVK